MKPASVLVLSLFLAPSLLAQSSTPATPDNRTSTCPLSLSAQHLSDGDLVKTGIAHPKGVGQALHLTVADSSHGQVVQAIILLHGWTPKGRFSEASADPHSSATRRQHVHFTSAQNQSASADLWVAGLSAITSVEISSATYADGSTWSSSGSLSCRITPDLFMPTHP